MSMWLCQAAPCQVWFEFSSSHRHPFHMHLVFRRLRWPGPPAGSWGWNYWSGRKWNGDKACEAGSWQSLSVVALWGRWRAATCFSLTAILLALRAQLHVLQPWEAQRCQWWAKWDLCPTSSSLGKNTISYRGVYVPRGIYSVYLRVAISLKFWVEKFKPVLPLHPACYHVAFSNVLY